LHFTIEARELSCSERRRTGDIPSSWTVDASDAGEALQRFTDHSAAEMKSMVRTSRDGESIATVRKDDSLFLLRIYRQ
jgi:hypothetical protein